MPIFKLFNDDKCYFALSSPSGQQPWPFQPLPPAVPIQAARGENPTDWDAHPGVVTQASPACGGRGEGGRGRGGADVGATETLRQARGGRRQ